MGTSYSGSIFSQPASGVATISFHTGNVAGSNYTGMVVSVSGIIPPFTIPLTARALFSFSGQSNFVGSGGNPPLTTGSVSGSWRITTPVAFGILNEAGSETPLSPFADYLRTIETGRGVIVHNWALGGQEIAAFQSGTTLFRQGISGTMGMVSASVNNLLTSSYYTSLIWDQGESDNDLGVQSGTYLNSLSRLLTDFRNNAQGIMGSSSLIPMFITQPSYAVFTASAQIAQEEFSRISSSVYITSPTYAFWHTGTAVDPHYRNTAHRRNGQYIAKAVNRVLFSGSSWTALRPSTITANGNLVTINFEGGDGSALVIDSGSVFRKPFLGFSYFDPQATANMPSIQSVVVSGADRQIHLTLTNPASSTGRIRYAFNNINNAVFGALGRYSIGGNIRDQDATPSIYSSSLGDEMDNLPLWNWLVAFDRPINSFVSGTGETDNLASGSIRTNGTGIATAYNLTTFDAASSFIWAFKIRATAWPGSSRLICDRNRNPYRGISLRTANNNLSVLCPVSLASTAESFNTPNGQFVNNQNYAVVIIYSGSGAANVNRASIWINDNGPGNWRSCDLSYTGTLGATLSSGSLSAFDFFNGNAGTTAAASLSGTSIGEMAIWRNQSATLSQIQEIFPGGTTGTMGTLGSSSLGLPDNWWSWNGNTRDKGRRGNHVFIFNTGAAETVIFSGNVG
ncbi:MAG: hypothetical protein HC875_40210 [Anaerolineales bacterium]|nr:hypothetical protein [Anaerolineales bacterium]